MFAEHSKKNVLLFALPLSLTVFHGFWINFNKYKKKTVSKNLSFHPTQIFHTRTQSSAHGLETLYVQPGTFLRLFKWNWLTEFILEAVKMKKFRKSTGKSSQQRSTWSGNIKPRIWRFVGKQRSPQAFNKKGVKMNN